MARKPKSSEAEIPQQAHLTPQQIKVGITKFERRINELKGFEPSTVVNHDDSRVSALDASIDGALTSVFGPNSVQYHRYCDAISIDKTYYSVWDATPNHEYQRGLEKGKANAIALLQQAVSSLEEELELQDNDTPVQESAPIKKEVPLGRDIFVVHGHDKEAKLAVSDLLKKLDFNPIILHEKADKGRTIIEKFSDHAGEASFAVVLLTPDDLGCAKTAYNDDPKNLNPRARQNVILELGFFIGQLGRSKVCALHKGGIEIPTDYQGVIFKQMDDAGAWHIELAKELKASGLKVDFNKIL